MNKFLLRFMQTGAAIPFSAFIWLLAYAGFDQTFWMSSLYGFMGGGVMFFGLGSYMQRRFLEKNRLTMKEYKYIKRNLKEANVKINRIQKSLFSVRHIRSLKHRMELLRLVKNIQKLSNREPRRFFKAEQFYFSHLDSIMELSEKYAFLSSQPAKNRELEYSLQDTQDTLKDLTKIVEKDLNYMLEEDLDHLNFEIDVAKHSIKKRNEIPDETRRLK
ncbi:5-bromo-4-chloroindolyl phosphate hydrolysis family protein [Mesobacillus selenatarsenatis]|uniref:5-bromo-4-chloroindolyl phosphate hydrolysis protein n=1 Tax=Mesobacillus selenatarsenatis (strain DSM 18680 / JCM 14380 / FERM P-15431 / SF-1) TaxID=1321606 RepID=A0A0A8XA99_MESS1|nr:5-bromo-4-chloroindolyl phosphate hydrolysis family protein [Mesobacillus selenatarsenatis]GAM16214.1 5-bromo-4-chloroindolyl phosphate hydrolysis protein [Mesobacillus selenatarsenatis SF-1]